MNIESWLKKTGDSLRNTSSTPTLDSEVILAHMIGKDRAWLHAHPEFVLKPNTLKDLDKMINRRKNHEPIAYIVGKSEFYGRDFEMSADTLEPRPETETMIELFLAEFSELKSGNIIDVGTGSGSIIISLAMEIKNNSGLNLYGTDISKPALKVATKNRDNHMVDVKFFQGNLLEPILHKLNVKNVIILANLPYVPSDHTINEAARHEPDIAIFGGEDGLDLYREMFAQINFKCSVFTESLPPQHSDLRIIAESFGFVQTEEQDFIQEFKRS